MAISAAWRNPCSCPTLNPEKARKNHVRFRVGSNAGSDDRRATVHRHGQSKGEIPPQVVSGPRNFFRRRRFESSRRMGSTSFDLQPTKKINRKRGFAGGARVEIYQDRNCQRDSLCQHPHTTLSRVACAPQRCMRGSGKRAGSAGCHQRPQMVADHPRLHRRRVCVGSFPRHVRALAKHRSECA